MKKASERRRLDAWIGLGRRQDAPDEDPTDVWAKRAASARRGDAGTPITDAEAREIADGATAACALARARFLEASGAPAAAEALRRSAWRVGASRAEKLRLTFEAAREDPQFARVVAAADAARDGARWAEAETLYGRVSVWYPLHHGYRVQHAHMCKELGRLDRAELGYRDALALGAPGPDVDPHLEFVADRQGVSAATPVAPPPAGSPMGDRPCAWDIQALGYLFWREASLSDADVLGFLRRCATCDAVAALMIEDDRFVWRNGPFLTLMQSRR